MSAFGPFLIAASGGAASITPLGIGIAVFVTVAVVLVIVATVSKNDKID